ncbi:MAG: 50S ribosomal protein L5 [Candidatus Kerfeldbacteria bacterium RIFCSPHIGHO2_12_FULL_48_17]|uniref:Large ribosomal subunit protein uL5 n=1 Tax=Candidatus Kerfeldbacteria bacterium RIFCSPHIGHO2_12_FULL_48_17 TaxID=1798542 RepID=A0A1G2B6K4_9BACT|nr:MAG: 50S ribosomal protein L5 [Candidatus Kerfeldbacteria bacterium RIFCSPHIGHO2_12_FULL_48_17]
MHRLREKYTKVIVPALKKELKLNNVAMVPKITKVVVNVGAGRALQDGKYLDTVADTVAKITGQKPVKTLARKSISNFKIRANAPIGVKVTLRKDRMYDFIDKFVNVTLPRVHDFRGIPPKSVDGQGNLNIGIKEHIVFPEIKSTDLETIHGLEVTITTSAKDHNTGLQLLKAFGFPFQKSKA